MKYNVAKRILGEDFIPPETISEVLGIKYRSELRGKLTEKLPPMAIIEWCNANNHAVIAGPPRSMSILQIRKLRPDSFCSGNNWLLDQGFSRKDLVTADWIIIRKGVVPGSLNKALGEQMKLINDHVEFVPNCAQLGWALVVYGIITRQSFLPNRVYALTSSMDMDGRCIRLGNISNEGIHISSTINEVRCGDGLASARKI